MRVGAATLLLVVLSVTLTVQVSLATSAPSNLLEESPISELAFKSLKDETSYTTAVPSHSDEKPSSLLPYPKSFISPKEILFQEIRTLNAEATATARTVKKSNVKTMETDANMPEVKTEVQQNGTRTSNIKLRLIAKVDAKNLALQKMIDAEHLIGNDLLMDEYEYGNEDYKNGGNGDTSNDDDDDENDDDDEDDDEDDDDDESEDEEFDDEEEVMTMCPNYCKCSGQYAAATTATCTKLVEEQSFGPGVAHLRIENAEDIRLGPHALKSLGLQQLESIVITDTRITKLDRTAFDGITYLFAVNLTRNALSDIHPHTFQNNTQLSLLTISGNPLKYEHYARKTKQNLFDAPSITELDFSNNGLTKLPFGAFRKMQSLAYISLKGNQLKEVDKTNFESMEALVDLDLSYNLLDKLPPQIFNNSDLQTLRISGNNFSTLAIIKASKLSTLEASNNKIRVIAKNDLSGVPVLEQLVLRSNGLKRIDEHALVNIDQLSHLDISDNQLTSLTERHLRTNPRLKILLMSENPELKRLPVFKTTGLEYETYSVYRFECANCGLDKLEKGTFDAMPALVHLDLAQNRLNSLPDGLFTSLSSLRELDLSGNLIGSLGTNMFLGALTLNKLTLAGNPLTTLQVAPFLNTPNLSKLDVSRCALERVWSEARIPLRSLRFLSVRGNLLRQITVEELRATPKLAALDLSHNPMDCDEDFHVAVQWLTERGVTPTETHRYINDYVNAEDYSDSEGITQWKDLAKIVCDGVYDGPPPRPKPKMHPQIEKDFLAGLDIPEDTNTLLSRNFEGSLQIEHGRGQTEELEDAWTAQDQEYDVFTGKSMEYRPWYSGAIWPMMAVILVTLAILLLAAHVAATLAKRRGRGPVIRPPMLLRQGMIDNKNCGLVYKPLQEEIATPHMPKRGSFYSSSTFHYDKIVPESV